MARSEALLPIEEHGSPIAEARPPGNRDPVKLDLLRGSALKANKRMSDARPGNAGPGQHLQAIHEDFGLIVIEAQFSRLQVLQLHGS